ncbi:hypothetical protein NOR_04302 [Metarhizium rileyi]|uniref:Uncharacterized protein n=1 Tax=Metarhizium rileyi (strain RCEF 4871) TaxID=1649241 RepID=A0A167EDD8_METRR|nr:hypothetical protein NOR_04302 [Metarhizium rileyi RCEF 4871]
MANSPPADAEPQEVHERTGKLAGVRVFLIRSTPYGTPALDAPSQNTHSGLQFTESSMFSLNYFVSSPPTDISAAALGDDVCSAGLVLSTRVTTLTKVHTSPFLDASEAGERQREVVYLVSGSCHGMDTELFSPPPHGDQ